MDDFLAAELHYSDGRVLRFGPDESTPGDVPRDIQFSTQIPGGFGNGSIVLPRPANLRADDAMLFSWVRLYGPGSRTAYEGRVVGAPQVGPSEVRLELEGFVADLEHDKTFREPYVDRDLSHWGDPSVQRKLNHITAGLNPISSGGQVSPSDSGESGVTLTTEGVFTKPVGEWSYDNHGAGVVARLYVHTFSLINLGVDGFVTAVGFVGDDDVLTNEVPSAEQKANATWDLDFSATPKRVTGFRWHRTDTGAGTAGVIYGARFEGIVVFSDNGLTIRGTAPDHGYYPHDVIADVLSRTAPALNYTVGDSITEVEQALLQLAFLDPTTGRAVIEHVTLLGSSPYLHDWGVYDEQEFFWKPPGSYGRTWRVRKDQFATPTSDGPDSSTRINGIMGTYRDGAGKAHTVGPTGSGADYETDDLLDTDPENPAQRVGRKWDHLDVGVNSQEGAVFVCQMILAEANRINWRGKVKITGEVRDEAGNAYPPWLVRGGDHVIVEDAEDLTPRYINSTDYVNAGMELTASIGAWPHSSEVLMGQLAAAAELAGAR